MNINIYSWVVIHMNFENVFSSANEAINEFKEQSFVIKHGVGGIMFSAPHSVEQTRDGKIKYSEPQTGILVEMLHKTFGCPIIRKTSNCNDDANFDPISDYKEALVKYVNENHIEFLIDLHQLAPSRNVMIDFGTGNFKNINDKYLLNIFLSTFSENKLGNIQLDEPFDASYDYTVSSTIHRECEIPCLQIEINTKLVCDEYNEFSLDLIYKSLCDCYLKLKEIYK